MKTILTVVGGIIFLFLGIVGLFIPILPGLLFLLIAAACFATLSTRLRSQLSRHPRMRRFFAHLEHGKQLDTPAQIKLAFWAGLHAITPNATNSRRRRSGL